MEHTCGQCGAIVEDGRPFCANCGSPQIRVPVRPPTTPATEPLPPGTPEDVQPPAEPVVEEGRRPAPPPPPIPNRLDRRVAFSSALVAGLLASTALSIPLVPVAMLGMFAAGALAVTLYRRRTRGQAVTPWMGTRLGAIAGGMGFTLLATISSFHLFAGSGRSELRAALLSKMQETAAAAVEPEVHEMIARFQDAVSTDRGLLTIMLLFMLFAGVILVFFSALGGTVGAALFGRESQPKP